MVVFIRPLYRRALFKTGFEVRSAGLFDARINPPKNLLHRIGKRIVTNVVCFESVKRNVLLQNNHEQFHRYEKNDINQINLLPIYKKALLFFRQYLFFIFHSHSSDELVHRISLNYPKI